MINTKPSIKNRLKGLLSELKKFEVLTVLAYKNKNENYSAYKNKNDRQIFHLCTKLFASDLDIDAAFKSMHQSIITRIKNYACENWIVLDAIIKHSIKIFEC